MRLGRVGAVCVVVVTVVTHALLDAAGAQAPTVPLPPDVTLDPPAADVPESISRFAGAWAHGAWDGVVRILAVGRKRRNMVVIGNEEIYL